MGKDTERVWATISKKHYDYIQELVKKGLFKDGPDCLRTVIREWIELKETKKRERELKLND